MIKLFSVLPHSPLLHSGIGADVKSALETTLEAIQKVADDIYACEPDTIVLISDQPLVYETHALIHIHDPIQFDLSEFGDFSMKDSVTPDLSLIDQLQRTLRIAGHAVTLDTHDKLNFASAIPLSFILKKNPHVKLVAIAPPQNVPAKTLYEFGRALQDILMQSSKNIVVLAAGDGSHALNAKSPNPATKQGAQFDEYLQHILINRNASSLLNLDPKLVQDASQSIYAQICILFGAMHGIQTKYTTHSYEAPFGVGYFVASYQ